MKNKIIKGFWAIIIAGVFGLTSCSDMLQIHPNDYLDTSNHQLNVPNDTLYSVVGILKQLQPLGERYVVLGDLRGDLMDVTKNADMNLQEIANFTPTTKNPYVSTREYYAVINNCNYYLQRVDTNLVSGGRKVFKGEYAAVKAIRDWTYLQLALNYGKAAYITEPVLNIEDMNRDYPVLQCQQLIDTLLAADLPDLLDATVYPSYGGGLSQNSFISGPSLAGDMLLWLGAFTGNTQYYEQAAMIYYRFIVDNYLMGGDYYYNRYTDGNFLNYNVNWYDVAYYDAFSLIAYSLSSSETLTYPSHLKLFFPIVPGNDIFKYMLQPSQAAMNLWKNETYVYYNSSTRAVSYTQGDLRGLCPNSSLYTRPYGSYYYADMDKTMPCIAKFGYYMVDYGNWHISSTVTLYRSGKLYLRYAEALNAIGKPSVAFAVLKHGLKSAVLNDTTIINRDEITPLPPYCDFRSYNFSDGGYYTQTGIHSRGSGDVNRDTLYYAFREETLNNNREYYGFPEHLTNKQDSMMFVDAMICKELGLETAFEGNRFHDLMRFAYRWKNVWGDNNFLPEWVGRRNPLLKDLLKDENKWVLPMPE